MSLTEYLVTNVVESDNGTSRREKKHITDFMSIQPIDVETTVLFWYGNEQMAH